MNGCIKCLLIIYIEATAVYPILSQNLCADVLETYFLVFIKETYEIHDAKLTVGVESVTADYQNKNEPSYFFYLSVKCKI